MPHVWKPSVTVAAVIEQDGRFLLIEEETSDGVRINQPAGHLDPFESLQEAVVREVLEETAHDFTPTALVGMYMSTYHSKHRAADVTYLRFAFCGQAGKKHERELDQGILRAMWMTRDEIVASRDRHRSPLLLQCIDDYLRGQRAPLELVHTHASVYDAALRDL
jgi:8-oxo-dGTP pyrophosphatase MutT (NUDIX family)